MNSSEKECYLSLIIPAYNEERRLKDSLSKIIRYFSVKEYKFEIIIVDDGSGDTTNDVVKSYMQLYPNLHLIRNEQNRGKGYSVKTGVMNSVGKYIFFSDADLSAPIEEIECLLRYLEDGIDIVIGSRALDDSKILVKQGWFRNRLGKMFGILVRSLVVPGIMDSQCGFKGFKGEAAKKVFSLQQINGFSFDAEILFIARKYGFIINEIPVQWANSDGSKLNPFFDSTKMLFEVFKIKWNDLRGIYDK